MTHKSTRLFPMLLSVALVTLLPVIAGAALKPTLAANTIALELDGEVVGLVQSFEGGMPLSDVLTAPSGPDAAARKRPGPVRYSDIRISFGPNLAATLYQWMQDALAGKSRARNGAIVVLDHGFNERYRHTFSDALISRIAIPAIDATAAKTAFYFTLDLNIASARMDTGNKGKQLELQGFSQRKQITVSNFRATMAGLDTTNVTKIEAISVTFAPVANITGKERISSSRSVGAMTISNVVMSGKGDTAQSLWDWTTDFLVRGNNTQSKEKVLTIELLDPTLKTVLLTITARDLGVFKLDQAVIASTADESSGTRAHMYCQGVEFTLSGK